MLQHEAKFVLNGSWLHTCNTALDLHGVYQLYSPDETDGETYITVQGEMKYAPQDEMTLILLIFWGNTFNIACGGKK